MSQVAFSDPKVRFAFTACRAEHRQVLLKIRDWIFDQAARSPQVGKLEETLKWGEPSYLTPESKSGSTIRINSFDEDRVAMYFNCRTTLVEEFRSRFSHVFEFSKNRAVLIDPKSVLPEEEIRACIDAALMYHVNRKNASSPAAS